jgi:hypothetical protein
MIVNYEGADRTAGIEAQVRGWAAELDADYDHIARCDVRVEALASRPACRYRVRLAIALPGAEIVVSRDPRPETEREDASAALRDSFRAARRRLEEFVWRNPPDDLSPPSSSSRAG